MIFPSTELRVKQSTTRKLQIQEYFSGQQKMRTRMAGIQRWPWRGWGRTTKLNGWDCRSFFSAQNDLETGSWIRCMSAQLCPTLCDPWTVTCQAPLSIGFLRQEYWSGLPCPSWGDLLDPDIEPTSASPDWRRGGGGLLLSHLGSPIRDFQTR